MMTRMLRGGRPDEKEVGRREARLGETRREESTRNWEGRQLEGKSLR